VRKIAILPTLLTLGNAVSGFAAIAFASRIERNATPEEISFYFRFAGALIVLAMLFDALDGYVARLSKSASDFGAQLDSLCDAISFGVAPAFLLLRLGQVDWAESELARYAVAVVAGLYVVCTILRLARFNLETTTDPASHKRFKGLPSPAAAGHRVLPRLLAVRAELAGALPARRRHPPWPQARPRAHRAPRARVKVARPTCVRTITICSPVSSKRWAKCESLPQRAPAARSPSPSRSPRS
jgi:CDP-diacylglycerol--serine O-phosphatidyltransferase